LLIGVVGLLAAAALISVLVWVFVISEDDGEEDGKQPEDYTTDELEQALFTLDDLPSGWSLDPPEADDDDGDDSPAWCGATLDPDDTALLHVERGFSAGDMGPYLNHMIKLLPGETEANDAFRAFADDSSACPGWHEQEWTWTLQEMSFKEIGDQTAAFRANTTDVPIVGKVEMQAVFIQHGPFVILMSHMSIGLDGVDTDETEQFAALANDKLSQIEAN